LARAKKSDARPKFQLYKHIKISGNWRYCRAAIYSNQWLAGGRLWRMRTLFRSPVW
jgi:hypothetical protein